MTQDYFKIHSWLGYWYGRASKCENELCKYENPKRFEWALKKDAKYEKNRDNFIQLCCSCHRKMDYTDDQRRKISNSNKGVAAKNKVKVILNSKTVFESMTDASNKTGVLISSIHNNIKGLSKTTKIGIWKYYDQPN